MRHGASILVWFLAVLAVPPAPAAPLTIMVEDASEPFSRHDGTGYANDIVRAAFRAAGVDVRLDVVPYARCKKSLEDGATPACFSMSWQPGFEGHIVFADLPLFDVYADVFQRSPKPGAAGTQLSRGAVLGIVNGYEYPPAINDMARRGVLLSRNIDEVSNLKMLAHGRLDAAVVMTSDFEKVPHQLTQAGVTHQVGFAFRSGQLKSYIGFNLHDAESQAARRAFNRGYAAIIANHTRDRIRDAWMNRR